MTDIMKLATDYAQACYNLANPDSYDAELAEEARAALQSAIEALQTECADHKENAIRNARIAVSIRAERDALQAKLDAAAKQDAVAWSVTVGNDYKNCIEISHCESDVVAQYEESTSGGFESIYTLHKLYAAPKALAPEKGTELFDAWCDKSYADGMLLGWNLCESNHPETFQQLRSTRTEAALKVILANRAAHGIGGTP